MRLRDALLRAAKFAGDDPAGKGLNCVRCVPPSNYVQTLDGAWWPSFPAYITATNGKIGVLIPVDPQDPVPDLMMQAKAVINAFKGSKKDTRFTIEQTGIQTARIEFQSGNKFVIPCQDAEHYPPFPEFPPELHPFEGWEHIKLVLHAAQKDTKDGRERPALLGVHFHPRWTEATDQNRIARTSLALTHEPKLVPAKLFDKWPRKKSSLGTAVGWKNGHAFFWVDEELRFAECLDVNEYFNLTPMLPDAHLGIRVQLDRTHLKQSVKHAQTSVVSQQVEFRFGEDQLSVQGIEADGEVKFADTLPAAGARELVVMRVRGKLIWDALHNMTDDIITLCYSTPTDPIRLEGDRFVEAVWPLHLVEG